MSAALPDHRDARSARVGAVAIGRNEGERLVRCLSSVARVTDAIVYVDSGSTDDSVAAAQAIGAEVVTLNLAEPFTAARARNAGFARLMSLASDVEFVQFLDGDCELVETWLPAAIAALSRDPALAIVAGRRRERFPDASTFNRLCDIEWDTPVGEASYCGGDSLVRAAALRQVGGFRAALIAGEEPELCVRLRQAGWKIARIDQEMTLHDAAMTRLSQWWKRNVRAGHAYAEGAALHGAPPERHWVREVRSNWLWGLCVPVAAVALAYPTWGWSLLLLAGYVLLAWRIARYYRRRGLARRDVSLVTRYTLLGKLPQAIGQLKYRFGRMRGRGSELIEYKGAA